MGYRILRRILVEEFGYFQFPLWDTKKIHPCVYKKNNKLSIPFMGYICFFRFFYHSRKSFSFNSLYGIHFVVVMEK